MEFIFKKKAKFKCKLDCKQVGVHKQIFLRDHPTWLRDLRSPTTPQETDPVSTESPALCHSHPRPTPPGIFDHHSPRPAGPSLASGLGVPPCGLGDQAQGGSPTVYDTSSHQQSSTLAPNSRCFLSCPAPCTWAVVTATSSVCRGQYLGHTPASWDQARMSTQSTTL